MRWWWFSLVLSAAAQAQEQDYRRTVAQTKDGSLLCVTWSHRDVTYTVDAAGDSKTPGDSEFIAIDAAFSSWQALSDRCSDFHFIRGARTTNAQIGRNTENSNVLVFWENNCRDVPSGDACLADGSCANKYRCWDHSDATIALTTTTYSTRTGVVYDADIEFNGSPHTDDTFFLFTTVASPPCAAGSESVSCVAYDVQNTATHEIGHLVGFDHVPNPDSLMAATAPLGETSKRSIDQGTANGFCGAYPRAQPPVPCDVQAQLNRKLVAVNTGSFGCSCAGGPAAGVWAPFSALLLLLWRQTSSRGSWR